MIIIAIFIAIVTQDTNKRMRAPAKNIYNTHHCNYD